MSYNYGSARKHYTIKKTWRVIPTYPLYEMSAMAEVREKLSGRILTANHNNKGHHYHLLLDGKVCAVNPAKILGETYPELKRKYNEFSNLERKTRPNV